MENRSRIAFWAVFVAAAALLLLRSGSVPLTDPEEARFARTSVEMLRSSDAVVPTFEGAPHIARPPLLHWMQAFLFQSIGVSEFTARLPSIAATLGSLLLLGFVVRRRFGEEGAAWAAVFYTTMPLVLVAGKQGTLDALFAVHVLAAVTLDIAEPGEAGPYRSAAIGAVVGLAFLVKGPVGIVLPLLILLAGRTASGRVVVPGSRTALAAVAAWCVVVLPWGLAFVQRIGFQGTLATIRREALETYFAGTEHAEPSWFYAKVVLAGFIPWIGPLALGLVRVLGKWRDPAARTALYASAGLLAGLLFFSIGRGKLVSSIVPLAPLAAIVITWELGQELIDLWERRAGPELLVVTLASVSVLLGWGASALPDPQLEKVAIVGAAAYAAAAGIALLGMALQRFRWAYCAAALAAFILFWASSLWLYPAVARRRSAEPLIREVPALYSARPLVLIGAPAPSLTFYLDRLPEPLELSRLEERLARGDAPLLIFHEEDVTSIAPQVRAVLRELGHQGEYQVFEPLPAANLGR